MELYLSCPDCDYSQQNRQQNGILIHCMSVFHSVAVAALVVVLWYM